MNYPLRLKKYLHERFSMRKHLPLISVFTFSAICFSLMAENKADFIGWPRFIQAFTLTFGIFLLLRISDEHKDHEEDLKYRSYLPVARGLISLKELRYVAGAIMALHFVVIGVSPAFLSVYLLTIFYMGLMYFEFFAASWLRRHQLVYVFSHMLIIPLVDLVASSAHWAFDSGEPPWQLAFFFIVSFSNGIILEFGRKIKTPRDEEENVITYSSLWGTKKAIAIWSLVLGLTLIFALLSAWSISSPDWVYIMLFILFLSCLGVGLWAWLVPSRKSTRYIEHASGIWTIGMYLNLGALPFLIKHML